MANINNQIPAEGLAGLKQNWQTDLLSGFMVSLLAMPLSLGIAKASEFPAIYGIITAIIGGLIVSLIAGSRLTIKGPAAGLIVIVADAVAELGGGNNELGWHLALGAIVVAAVIQVLFGVFKLGKFNDFFPLPAIHGMLAAIGLIIISKQIHNLIGIDPKTLKGLGPIDLYAQIPHSFMTMNMNIAIIGFISLAIVLGWPMIKQPFLKKIPAPLVVLVVSIPLGMVLGVSETSYSLVKLYKEGENFFSILKFNADFGGMTTHTGAFLKFVAMFALVGSIESLLTVKAIDLLDPYKRKSNADKDLIAVGTGNILSGLLGGLPMISEVARSSANVANGAKTRWANFFHGASLLVFVVLLVPVIQMIPISALAAMLIGVGIKLAHPKEFRHMLHIGKETFITFLVTIMFTLLTDLLIGVILGIVVNLLLNLYNGASFKSMFKTYIDADDSAEIARYNVTNALTFSNFIVLKQKIEQTTDCKEIIIDLSKAPLIDYSSMEGLHRLGDTKKDEGMAFLIVGLDKHTSTGHDKFSAMKLN